MWAEGAPPQDYLEGERLSFASGGCYVGESFSRNHKYGAVSNCAANINHPWSSLFCSRFNNRLSQLAAASGSPHGLGLFSNHSSLPAGNHFSRFCCDWRFTKQQRWTREMLPHHQRAHISFFFALLFVFSVYPPFLFLGESTFTAKNESVFLLSGFVSRMTRNIYRKTGVINLFHPNKSNIFWGKPPRR